MNVHVQTLLLTTSILLLSACSPNNETVSTASAASQTSNAAEPAIQTLESKDGKIRIMIENGNFNDVSTDNTLHPEGMAPNELTLLQHDATTAITLYAGDLGEAKTDAQTYFTKLKSALESASNIENLRVGIATDNRMNYRFTQQSSDGLLTENCIAIHETHLYTVCAASLVASAEQLAGVLKDVHLIK